MKKLLFMLPVLFITVLGVAQEKKLPAQVVKFTEQQYNFGKIKQNQPVTHDFAFNNISGKPVVIENATASCGCTTPVWPQKPIAKSKKDKITAGFNAAAAGPFEKTIFVKISGVEQPVALIIKGEVLNAEDYAKFEKENGKKSGK
ncbi:MAG: DUF1573 domain-containing protein [Sphingobacteriales bacterium]|jgi:hypothetical protein|nr:MAG: DUF1573 domain-containing protein [Sphingobacteriales bacterium]